jgi:hypothetical protein
MRIVAILVLLTALVVGESAVAQDTLKQGDMLSGRLRYFLHQHPNGTWIKVYQITADHPRPFADKDEFCPDYPPVTFHLLVMDDKAKKARLDHLLGKTVAVIVDGFFCSQTAWHVGDAVVTNWHFVTPSKR